MYGQAGEPPPVPLRATRTEPEPLLRAGADAFCGAREGEAPERVGMERCTLPVLGARDGRAGEACRVGDGARCGTARCGTARVGACERVGDGERVGDCDRVGVLIRCDCAPGREPSGCVRMGCVGSGVARVGGVAMASARPWRDGMGREFTGCVRAAAACSSAATAAPAA